MNDLKAAQEALQTAQGQFDRIKARLTSQSNKPPPLPEVKVEDETPLSAISKDVSGLGFGGRDTLF